ncbi:uncharacterized protein LOC112466080 [Temnothorax curvispinosus]|uniref:Uncharacterized protein LOC112466080 n=1 Tax=Temnothorax curvispinosus TaxID=300111 RepID=A0A6J1R542_9HYME|nr:uncharacterized protein LOC112466080 [Temnothorax curvispinosus]XP_024889732.1 uncharacterized protein LOC112466080 [Temnothorax curvispinosus]XP_024889734.1 uncharacterized protein LOC112466080 [Temnothorax curvispinosus]XP_024889735.1 uncharacterized protein LOC112466080 [Temnothorax curvispinosus]XP_024889736.1 uncharacterized protein LOC112466080 [Temnothorax curvispinosus]
MDGERDFQLCTNDHGQPIVDDQGRNIYYCKITGDVAVFDNEPHTLDEASINENTNEIEKDVTQSVEPQSEGQMSATNEDRFTHEMTVKLLEIVQSKLHFLNDKMHPKKKIWADITTEMQKTGYLLTYGKKAADKCHQRWRNLEKMYHGHCRYMKSTGTGKKKPPKYFDEMHELIGEKHSSQPVNLLDSLDDVSTASASDTCSIETKSSEAINNNETDNFPDNVDNESNNIKENIDSNVSRPSIFKNVKKSVRPKVDSVSTVLKQLHEQDVEIESKRFKKFETLLEEQNKLRKQTLEQRGEFLSVLKTLIKSEAPKNKSEALKNKSEAPKKNKKRKYSSESSDSQSD